MLRLRCSCVFGSLFFGLLFVIAPTTVQAAIAPYVDLTSRLLTTGSVVKAEYARAKKRYVVLKCYYGTLSPGDLLVFNTPDPWWRENGIAQILWVSPEGKVTAAGPHLFRDDKAYLEAPYGWASMPFPVPEDDATLVLKAKTNLQQFEVDIVHAVDRIRRHREALENPDPQARRAQLLALIDPLPRVQGVLTEWTLWNQTWLTDEFALGILSTLVSESDLEGALEIVARVHMWLGRDAVRRFQRQDLIGAACDAALSTPHRTAALFVLQGDEPDSDRFVDLLPLLEDRSAEVRRATARLLGHHLRRQIRSSKHHSVEKSRLLLEPLFTAWSRESDPLTRNMIEWGVADQNLWEELAPKNFPTLWIACSFAAQGDTILLYQKAGCHGNSTRDDPALREIPQYHQKTLVIAQHGAVVYREELGIAFDRYRGNEDRHSEQHRGLLLSTPLKPGSYQAWIEGSVTHFGKRSFVAAAPTPLVIAPALPSVGDASDARR